MKTTHTTWEGHSGGLETTLAIGAAVAHLALAGDVIALNGELGAGKTQFVRGLADGLGIGRDAVSSPTFVLAQEYDAATPGGLRLVHIDAYRLDGNLEAESIGLDGGEDMRQDAVVAVEWAERLGDVLGDDRLIVTIEHEDADARRLAFAVHGSWQARAASLVEALNEVATSEVTELTNSEMQSDQKAGDSPAKTPKPTPCPICSKDVLPANEMYPFCSPRCRQVDLGRWLNESYVISRPIEQSDLEQDD